MPSLAAVGLSVPEAIFLAVFWFFALVATSYFSFEDVMNFGPVATVIDLAAAATEKVPILLAVLALSGAAWGLFKYRKAITKSMLSLVTRRRR